MPNYNKKPYLAEQGFKKVGDKPLSKQLNIRVTDDMYEAIKKVPNHRELIRVLLQEWLDNLDSDNTHM